MNWSQVAAEEAKKPYYKELYDFVSHEYETSTCYPPFDEIMTAMALTPLEDVRCVILGQDPYHGPNQAMGLSFSVRKGVAIPPSLRNIYQEIHDEFGYDIPAHGDLTQWARSGVLLLNAVLTVKARQAASHSGKGWETYTDAVLSAVNQKDEPVVFMLWGNFARSKKSLVTNPRHLVLETTHPSPFSADRGFFGCGHFRKCNDFLAAHGQAPIDWHIT